MGIKHKHSEFIKAWADGADIQLKTVNGWRDITVPNWGQQAEYRVKPELKYVPYTTDDYEDCCKNLLGVSLKGKSGNACIIIHGIHKSGGILYINHDYSKTIFEHYTHLDGKPVGKLE